MCVVFYKQSIPANLYDSQTKIVGSFSVMESLILAQNERWRHGLGMQVERESLRRGQWRKGE